MSYGISISAYPTPLTCDHLVTAERYIVSTQDWRTLLYASDTTLRMRAPLNAKDVVRVSVGETHISKNDPVYGYSFTRDTDREAEVISLASGQLWHKIVFNNPVRVLGQTIEVSYYTFANFCLKCAGTGIVQDFSAASNGSLLHVWGSDKLAQKTLQWLLASRCAFYPSYVCRLRSYVGRKYGSEITDADISSVIVRSLETMRQVQNAQARTQRLDPTERLQAVKNVLVSQGGPTLLNLQVNLVQGVPNGSTSVNFQMMTGS